MPKRPPSGQGWPVGGPSPEREAQGTEPSRCFFYDGSAPAPGAALFGYFLASYIHNIPKGVTYDGQADS